MPDNPQSSSFRNLFLQEDLTPVQAHRSPVPLLFLVGPTAVGKTELALQVAERLGTIILSCDAYCVYKGMNIGTAKPTPEELARVPHRGVNLVPLAKPFSIEDYREEAVAAIAEADARGRPLLVAGGSGFYLKSFFAPVVDTVHVPASVRARVAGIEAEAGLDGLQAALRACGDTGAPDSIDWENPRRVAKALERCLASGQSLRAAQNAFARLPAPFPERTKTVCLLERPVRELHQRIEKRVDGMLAEGLIDEVSALCEQGLEANLTAEAAIGYRETLKFLRGEITSQDELREQIVIHTRQLARKQRTWFRKQIPIDRTLPAGGAKPQQAFPEWIDR